MKLTFLGTGTSFGVPVIGCDCDTCTSTDPRDRRTRHGAVVETAEGRLLVDTPPELRLQLLAAGIDSVDAIWFTHVHADPQGDRRPGGLDLDRRRNGCGRRRKQDQSPIAEPLQKPSAALLDDGFQDHCPHLVDGVQTAAFVRRQGRCRANRVDEEYRTELSEGRHVEVRTAEPSSMRGDATTR